MVLVLAIGDFLIPYRSPEIAARFRSLLVPGKIQHILCTGNLVSLDVEDYLRSLSSDVHIVRGDMDTEDYPSKLIVNIGNIAFGVCHGHQASHGSGNEALTALRREMGVDVMIAGHTHQLSVRQGNEGGLYINPGSATGCPTVSSQEEPDASFVLIDVQGNKIVTYSYVLERRGQAEEDVRVDRCAFDRVK